MTNRFNVTTPLVNIIKNFCALCIPCIKQPPTTTLSGYTLGVLVCIPIHFEDGDTPKHCNGGIHLYCTIDGFIGGLVATI